MKEGGTATKSGWNSMPMVCNIIVNWVERKVNW